MAARAIEVPLTGADQAIHVGQVKYMGFSIRETAAATAVVRIYDGTAASGGLLDAISLAAGESAREWYGDEGILATNGIYVDVVSGAIEGSIRVA